jgi:hypothetical protein
MECNQNPFYYLLPLDFYLQGFSSLLLPLTMHPLCGVLVGAGSDSGH